MRLVGGTSLALQIGHRRSVDIDLFGKMEAEEEEIYEILKGIGNLNIIKRSRYINICSIDGIKVDIVKYPYVWLENIVEIKGLRLAGIKDISAMKLAAITGRGTKKDFIDLFFLFRKFNLKEMIELYGTKYNDGSEAIVLKSLTYFIDAEDDEEPLMFRKISWGKIKDKIRNEVKKYIKES